MDATRFPAFLPLLTTLLLFPAALTDAHSLKIPQGARRWALLVACAAALVGHPLHITGSAFVLCLAAPWIPARIRLLPADAVVTAALAALIGLLTVAWVLLVGGLLLSLLALPVLLSRLAPAGQDRATSQPATRRLPLASALLLGVMVVLPPAIAAESPESVAAPRLHVSEQPLAVVLGVIAEIGGFTAHLDHTVIGTISLSADVSSPRVLFEQIAEEAGCFVDWVDGRAFVGRVRVAPSPHDRTRLDLDARDAPFSAVVRDLMATSGVPIQLALHRDPRITLHLRSLGLQDTLQQLLQQVPDLTLERRGAAWLIREPGQIPGDPGPHFFQTVAGEHGVRFGRLQQRVLLSELARYAGLNLIQVPAADPPLAAAELVAQSPERLIIRVLESLGLLWVRDEADLRVVAPAEAASDARFFGTERLSFRYRPAQAALDILSRVAAAGGWHCRVDPAANALEMTASLAQLPSLMARLAALDTPAEALPLLRVDLHHRDADAVLAAMDDWLGPFQPRSIGHRSITVRLPDPLHDRLRAEIAVLDRESEAELHRLSHQTADAVLLRLPDWVRPGEVRGTPDPWSLLLTGTPERILALQARVRQLDSPVPQIRYQVLVVQRSRQNRVSWDSSIGVDQLLGTPDQASDGATVLQGAFGELLDIDLDLFATFGWLFAVQISAGLAGDAMQVLADTSITGLAGEALTLSSLETFRYRESSSSDAGSTASATREISSGLVLELHGELTGSGAVEIAVRASISARGSDDATDVNPPATSERLVQTRVRTQPGVPIVIGGLILESEMRSSRHGGPFAVIPILRLLGGTRRQDRERSELTIYILPRVDEPDRVDHSARVDSILAGVRWP